jgi:hypothetical protein
MNSDYISNYFKNIGIGHRKSDAVFTKKGRQRFGKMFDEMMSLIVSRGDGIKSDPYSLKNSSLDLSLYIGEHFSANTWRAFGTWLIQESNFETPSRVLDLGCENGVLTCFLGSL